MKRSNLFDREYRPCWDYQGQYYADNGVVVTGSACVYCGELATDREHVIPYWFVSGLISARHGDAEGLWTWVVPSCSECNSIGGPLLFVTPAQKRKHIRERLAAKYSSEINGASWSDEDFEDMGPGLRQFVQASQARAEILRARVAWSGPLPVMAGSSSLVAAVKSELAKREVADGGRVLDGADQNPSGQRGVLV